MTDSRSSRGGITLPNVLTVAFIILKLTHVIDWSWWWVLAPTWATFVFLAALVGILSLLIALQAEKKKGESL